MQYVAKGQKVTPARNSMTPSECDIATVTVGNDALSSQRLFSVFSR
jgi:hypothetical protein